MPRNVLRVFVSSTFSDMQAERDELMLRVFPVLRELCESRGGAWEEIDLRWGITTEQIAEGELLPICFAEIDEAWPFFIGLIGHRYGSRVDRFPSALLAANPWLATYASASVTELEVRRSLQIAREGTCRFFYFRDSPAPAIDPETESLRAELFAAGEPISRYDNVSQLGAFVLRDLAQEIEQLLPIGEPDDGVAEEDLGQSRFADSITTCYAERRSLSTRLDRHFRNRELPLVVTGESGSGKSALLSAWATHVRTAPRTSLLDRLLPFVRSAPPPFVCTHFGEATPRSSSWTILAQRLIHAVRERYGVTLMRPQNVDELRRAFIAALRVIPADETFLLVIDGADHLADAGASPLGWLPETFPPNVRVVISTRPGIVLEELQRRRWPMLQLEPLTLGERTAMVQQRLERMHRSLTTPAMQKLVEAKVAQWPVGVDAMLEELRVFGDHFGLQTLIDEITVNESIDALYEDVLPRLESGYGEQLTAMTLSLLALSPHGLSAREILDTMERVGKTRPLPIRWSQLRLALDPFLLRSGGLLRIAREPFLRAVRRRYPRLQTLRGELITTLMAAPRAARRHQAILEQLVASHDWPQARLFLADAGNLEALWGSDPATVLAACRSIEATGGTIAVDAKASASSVELLLALGHRDAAARAAQALVESRRRDEHPRPLQEALSRLAAVYEAERRFRQAGHVLREEEALCRQLDDRSALAACLGNQGVVLLEQDQLDAAAACFAAEQRVCAEIHDDRASAASADHRAVLALRRAQPGKALSLAKEHEQFARRTGDPGALAASLGNQALALAAQGRLTPAITLHRQEEALLREVCDERRRQHALGNLAPLLMRKADYDGAKALLDERAAICERHRLTDGAADTLLQRAVLYGEHLRLRDTAIGYAEEALRLAQKFDVPRVAEAARKMIFARP